MNNERLEMILEWAFGFTLLILYAALSHEIAIRQVTEDHSFGLPTILNSLAGLGGAWGVLIVARRKERKANANDSKPPDKV